ncbi:uncharacterized protein [Aristolochia californica]|uniref:uncharacterized protein n=1 Tax=Aristolochia californica TaxID=171875 RepID=UPI0035E1B592
MRHFDSGTTRRAASTAGIFVINIGDGLGEHPPQALLDVYTIGSEIGKWDGISVTLGGDLAMPGCAIVGLANYNAAFAMFFTGIAGHPSGMSRLLGFVAFSTPEEASHALAYINEEIVVNQPLYVALA